MEENMIIENEEITDLVPTEEVEIEIVEDNNFGKGMLIGVLGAAAVYGLVKGGKKAFAWGKGKVNEIKAKKGAIDADFVDEDMEEEE